MNIAVAPDKFKGTLTAAEAADIIATAIRETFPRANVTEYPQADGGYLIDTPGFSSLDMEKAAGIEPENLPYCFREFAPYLGACKFRSCRHGTELGCAVRAAVERGDIEPSRYESYLAMREKAEEAAKTKY